MSSDPTQPRSFHADLDGAYGEVEITLGDEPTVTFSRPRFGFTRPLPREELRALAAGRFGAGFDAQLRACTLPPAAPLGEAEREGIVRLADRAWSAVAAEGDAAGDVTAAADTVPFPTPPAGGAAGGGELVAAPGDVPAPPPAVPRRTLTVVLTLRPDGPDSFRALVGVGADGCDPHFGATGAPLPLAAVLGAVPAVVAAAEARWLTAPRYPRASRPSLPAPTASVQTAARAAARPVAGKTGERAGEATAGASGTAAAPPAPAKPAAKQQISLFG